MFMMTQGINKPSGNIESSKEHINMLFKNYWFCIPSYQRSYVWGNNQIDDLLDDLFFAMENNPDKEYFLGSLVLQKSLITEAAGGNDIRYILYDVLDGQQRLTTLFIMFAVIRDKIKNNQYIDNCKNAIFQEHDASFNQPERLRLEYKIKDDVKVFVEKYIKEYKGTLKTDDILQESKHANISVSNMANAILYIQDYFKIYDEEKIIKLFLFIFTKVLLIYVAAEDLEDAYRLFTILNNRGLPLSNSDILKAINIGAIEPKQQDFYARIWESMESEFGQDEFDRFLSHIRTILVKEKARVNLLKEFEETIYKNGLLETGIDTVNFVKKYRDNYAKVLWFENLNLPVPEINEFINLVVIMREGLPSTDWIPPLLHYYDKFDTDGLLQFLRKLECKMSGDWILQYSPTTRLGSMNSILKVIEKANSYDEVLNDKNAFSVDKVQLMQILSGNVYGSSYLKFVLLKLEYLFKDNYSAPFSTFSYVSIEHILPQNPAGNSEWVKLFTESEREEWKHKIGNLVLISRRKNSQFGNTDFAKKKKRYFSGYIDSFPNSLRVMQYNDWNLDKLKQRHFELLDTLMKSY